MDVNRKIRIDGDYLQSYQDDYIELQIDKMNQRLTFFSIVFVIIIGVVFTFSFFYVRNNVQKVPQEVQDLSHQVMESMSTLSERHAQLESTIQNKLSLLEKLSEALRKDQREIQDSVDHLKRTKIDQNDISKVVGNIRQDNFEAIEEVRTHINEMNKTFTAQFNTFSEQFQAFNQDVNTIVQNSIASIQKELQGRLSKISESVQSVDSELDALNTKVADFSSSLDNITKATKDMIDSEKLEEFLSIERDDLKNKAALQKMIMDNRIKALEEKLETIRLQINNIQSRRKKITPAPEPFVQQQIPLKTKKKNLLPKTNYVEPDPPPITQKYSPPPKPVFQPIGKKPSPGKMIEEDLSD
ncbi:hypothetical protein MHK_008371 [Candidatus Magnetomorum sp. HK-1]|nr:hypothetical protein MHK_008371 [Candidatus Magnetomorum sp. HK-1]